MTDTTAATGVATRPVALAPRRLAWIAASVAATLIPLVMISSLVGDREGREAEVQAAIARSWGPKQIVSSPTFAVPVTDRNLVTSCVRLQPKTLDVAATLAPERRSRGIYGTPMAATQSLPIAP